MLTFFSTGRKQQKLVDAIRQGDLDATASLLGNLDKALLNQPLEQEQHPAELAIRAAQPKVLEILLAHGCDPLATSSDGENLLQLGLRQSGQSLGLITRLLKAGARPSVNEAAACFDHCAPEQLMMHLSRLLEHDAQVINDTALTLRALQLERQDLVHFMIHSGAPLPEEQAMTGCNEAIVAYARRCAEDRRIRSLLHPF